jgi:hypothetical protein
MTKPREVELWPCDYSAVSLAPWCQRRATTILALSKTPRGDPIVRTQSPAHPLNRSRLSPAMPRRPKVPYD